MFTELQLRNFKGFREQSFDLAPLTLFIGGNGTGKSTVLQALAFLKQSSSQGQMNFRPGLIELGDFNRVVHFSAPDLDIGLSFKGIVHSLGVPWPRIKSTYGHLPIHVDSQSTLLRNGDFLGGLSIVATDGVNFQFRRPGAEERRWEDEFIQTQLRYESPFKGFYVSGYGYKSNSTPDRQVLSELAVEDLRRLGHVVEKQLSSFFLVPSTRGFVGQEFPLQQDFQADLVAARGYLEFASNAASALAMRRDLEDQISDWLESVTGFRVQSSVLPNHLVSVALKAGKSAHGRQGFAVDAIQEGFGTNQLATVLLQIALAGEHSTIGIEEPEIHLHPDSQRRFVETLVRILKQAHVQFIMTTHSERILSRVLLLVAKGELKPEDVAIYSFEKNSEGVCSAQPLEIDKQGRVSGGLRGFFEEDALDLREYIEALERG